MPGIYRAPKIHKHGVQSNYAGRVARFLRSRRDQQVRQKFTAISEALDQALHDLVYSAGLSQGPWQDKQPARCFRASIRYRPVGVGEHSRFFSCLYRRERDDNSIVQTSITAGTGEQRDTWDARAF